MSNDLWWESDEEDAHEDILRTVWDIEEENRDFHQTNLRCASLYSGRAINSLDGSFGTKDPLSYRGMYRSGENATQNVVDTATSLIAKNRPKGTFSTTDAEYSTRHKAKMLDQYCYSVFQQQKVYRKTPLWFRDAAVYGTGVLKVFDDAGRAGISRRLIDNIVVNEKECQNDHEPRSIHEVMLIDKTVLKRMYPEAEDEIEDAAGRQINSFRQTPKQLVRVVESYHVPSERGGDDGVRSVVINGKTLEWDKWVHDWHPYVFHRWRHPATGFYGHGLVEQLAWFQLRLNRLNAHIEKCQNLASSPLIFVEMSSKVHREVLQSNKIMRTVYFRGRKPEWFVPQAVGTEIYQFRKEIVASMFNSAGVSQMSAHSTKPAGIEAGIALRELGDIETQRFVINVQEFEAGIGEELPEKLVSISRDIYKEGGEVTFPDGDFVKQVPWQDVDLPNDTYRIDVEPSSILSRTPSGRIQEVTDLMQYGIFDRDEARDALNHPDVDRKQSLANADIEITEQIIQRLGKGERLTPDAYQNLDLTKKMVQQGYLRAKLCGAPQDILENYRNYVNLTVKLIQKMQPKPEAVAGQPMPPDMAPTQGEPPPMGPMGAMPFPQGAVA